MYHSPGIIVGSEIDKILQNAHTECQLANREYREQPITIVLLANNAITLHFSEHAVCKGSHGQI